MRDLLSAFDPDTDIKPTEAPDRFILDGGYVVLVRLDHPLAGPRGTLLEHRLVLYDTGVTSGSQVEFGVELGQSASRTGKEILYD